MGRALIPISGAPLSVSREDSGSQTVASLDRGALQTGHVVDEPRVMSCDERSASGLPIPSRAKSSPHAGAGLVGSSRRHLYCGNATIRLRERPYEARQSQPTASGGTQMSAGIAATGLPEDCPMSSPARDALLFDAQ